MSLTPVEIRHVKLGKGVGYKRESVDRLLADVVASYEDVWRDRADLADRVEAMEVELGRYREMEAILRSTLVSAESAAADLRERARREAQVILDEARSEARAIAREALREGEGLRQEARRIRALLGAALASVEDAAAEPVAPAAQPAQPEPGFASHPAGSLLEDTAEHVLPKGDFRAA